MPPEHKACPLHAGIDDWLHTIEANLKEAETRITDLRVEQATLAAQVKSRAVIWSAIGAAIPVAIGIATLIVRSLVK